MAYSHLFYGKVGVGTSSSDTPLISLDPTTGTITAQQICGNINISANVNWNEYDVDATFRTLTLSDVSINNSSTVDRVRVQLPNTNDIINIDYRGAIIRANTSTGQANMLIGIPTPNNGGVQCRFNTNAPNLQLYAPDSGGAVALYNTANAGYSWYLGTGGDAEFNNISVRGAVSGVVLSEAVAVYVNGNYTVPNDANNYELLINAGDGFGSGNLTITIAEDPTHQQQINIVLINLGTAANIAVGDGTPELAFAGPNGLYSFVDLKARGLGKTSFKYVNYGINGGDWWTFN